MGVLDNYKKSQVILKKNKFSTKFDYSDFNEEDKENLVELEKKALYTGEFLRDNIKELGEIFLEAQNIFANNKNGMFRKWYENLGYRKDFVYMCLDRKSLSIKYDNNDIYKFSDRVVKDIKKISKESDEAVFEILEAEDPKEKVKEIKEVILKKGKDIALKNNYENEKEISIKLQKLAKKVIKKKIDEEEMIKILKMIEEIEKII